jgi:hypothetical protein
MISQLLLPEAQNTYQSIIRSESGTVQRADFIDASVRDACLHNIMQLQKWAVRAGVRDECRIEYDAALVCLERCLTDQWNQVAFPDAARSEWLRVSLMVCHNLQHFEGSLLNFSDANFIAYNRRELVKSVLTFYPHTDQA